MGQKIHPLGLRIGITQKHRSSWFADSANYSRLLQEDYSIRKSIQNYVRTSMQGSLRRQGQNQPAHPGIACIQINRVADQVQLDIYTAFPALIVQEDGQGIERLRQVLQKSFTEDRNIRIAIHEISRPDSESTIIAEYIAQQLERRVAFRRAMKMAIQRAKNAGVKGIKIQVAGRLNGAEIARAEWLREGRVPLHTLRADIDYCQYEAQTIYGILGIKVWIFKGEVVSMRR
uniref:ribosomal protein S3 n=1 Tax=Streptofilum capillatum TaxID=2058781 RepID=UPI00286A2AF8|nr:ribosomal protein S3 [Streptofilum capillatum]WKT08541.1 ribosomal protein S3 [Streptofilum capillatum]WKT08640.1 ribosomal protein S3 [Streptofilum sp. BC4-VF8pt]WKT08739.1 ribosomal protein S3 [Streptofilum sp. ZNP2-VF4pt]